MKTFLKILAVLIVILSLVFVLGPKQDFPAFDGQISPITMPLDQLADYVEHKEDSIQNLRPDNQSALVWYDSIRKTPYALVYLHGWSASSMEGDPLHRRFAKRYGMNLYLPLLTGHGLDTKESFIDLTPRQLIESAKEAIAIGQLLGDKVILMTCSTGATLGAYLAANNPELVEGIIMYSPNIDVHDPMASLLTKPWGLQMAKQVAGPYYHFDMPPGGDKYWTTTYRTEGLIALKTLVDETMTKQTFDKIDDPIYIGYYYKDEDHFDDVVSIDAMKAFYEEIETPADKKRIDVFPNGGGHVFISSITNKDLSEVESKLYDFSENTLGLHPIDSLGNDSLGINLMNQ